ncbi:uncharacterized protein C1orf105 homolog [Thomomys bottae]
MERRQLKTAVPKFDKVPWLSEASMVNKPLVLSLPKRSPHFFATSFKKSFGLPILFQVPDDLWKAKNQSNSILLRKKPLCPSCQEVKMVQPTTIEIPDDLKLSFEKLMYHRTMNSHQPKTSESASSQSNISTALVHSSFFLCYSPESIHYRLPIMGSRMAVFHGLLSDAYRALEKTQHSSSRRTPMRKTVKQWSA